MTTQNEKIVHVKAAEVAEKLQRLAYTTLTTASAGDLTELAGDLERLQVALGCLAAERRKPAAQPALEVELARVRQERDAARYVRDALAVELAEAKKNAQGRE